MILRQQSTFPLAAASGETRREGPDESPQAFSLTEDSLSSAAERYDGRVSGIAVFLREHGVRLRKNLGQHFLIDRNVLRAIVDAADITVEDHVVEIGAGIGILTAELLKRAGSVTAIELDRRLIPLLEEYLLPLRPGQGAELHIVQGDALQLPFPDDAYKIVANIPYEITSPLLRHAFVTSRRAPTSLTLLIQREVAEKICQASAQTLSERSRSKGAKENRGMLAILVQLFGSPRIVRNVPSGAFLPPPNVQSTVLHITCHTEPLADPATLDEVFTLTRLAFGKKRKMLRGTIGKIRGGGERLRAASIDPERRPQTLSVEEWIALASTRV